MKFSLIVAVVVLALAQGSFAEDVNLETIAKYFEGVQGQMAEFFQNQDLTNQAQAFIEEQKAMLEPLATQIQEQIKTLSTQVEEQMGPMAANAQLQIAPIMEKMQQQVELLAQKVAEQTKAIAN